MQVKILGALVSKIGLVSTCRRKDLDRALNSLTGVDVSRDERGNFTHDILGSTCGSKAVRLSMGNVMNCVPFQGTADLSNKNVMASLSSDIKAFK